MRILAALMVIGLASKASAFKYAEGISFSNSGPVYVSITDGTKGDCWTNRNEVRDYAISLIEAKGGTVVQSAEEVLFNGIAFELKVGGKRDPNLNFCYGIISANFVTWARAEHAPEVAGLLFLSQKEAVALKFNNFNQQVLEHVQKAVEEW